MLGDATIASATCIGVWFIDVTAVQALFVGVAGGFHAEAPSLQVVVGSLVSEEILVAQWAVRGQSWDLAM